MRNENNKLLKKLYSVSFILINNQVVVWSQNNSNNYKTFQLFSLVFHDNRQAKVEELNCIYFFIFKACKLTKHIMNMSK